MILAEEDQAGAMSRQILRIISNLRFDGLRTERFSVTQRSVFGGDSWWGGVRLFLQAFRCDVAVLDGSPRALLVACLLHSMLPFQRCKLVSVDFLLSRPVNWKQRLVARLKGLLLREVDRFVFYITDLSGLERFYGISPPRCSYVPFKVNHEKLPPWEQLSTDGDFVLTGGRTHRDLRTFVEAMRRIDYPGVLLCESASLLKQHGTDLDLSNLPSNLVVEQDDGRHSSFVKHILGAKVVVVPTLPGGITGVGMSTYLLAMGLRKCVIVAEGPGTRGLLTDQAIVVPAGDPAALADAIRQVWEDKDLRQRTADSGRRYAEQRGGQARLLSDIADVCGQLVFAGRSTQRCWRLR